MSISDAGLLAYRGLDDSVDLTDIAGNVLAAASTGKIVRHQWVGLQRQSVFGRLAGYEDVDDAERLRCEPAMGWMVGGPAPMAQARLAGWAASRASG